MLEKMPIEGAIHLRSHSIPLNVSPKCPYALCGISNNNISILCLLRHGRSRDETKYKYYCLTLFLLFPSSFGHAYSSIVMECPKYLPWMMKR